MGIRYYKRVKIGKNTGLNISKSGVSSSVRTQAGSIGTRGFSIRTGIPGLSYRKSWGKNNGFSAVLILLFMALFWLLFVFVQIVVRASIFGFKKISELRKGKK